MSPDDIDVPALFAATLHDILPDRPVLSVDRKTVIAELGVDSISLMEVIGVLEDELGVALGDEEIMKIRTVGDVERIVLGKRKDRGRTR